MLSCRIRLVTQAYTCTDETLCESRTPDIAECLQAQHIPSKAGIWAQQNEWTLLTCSQVTSLIHSIFENVFLYIFVLLLFQRGRWEVETWVTLFVSNTSVIGFRGRFFSSIMHIGMAECVLRPAVVSKVITVINII